MKIKDPLLALVEDKIDTVKILSSYFPEWMDCAQNVKCPFHDDNKTPSLHISEDGRGFCHGCGHKFSSIIDLVMQMEDISKDEAVKMLYSDVIDAIPDHEIKAYTRTLWKNKKALKYLADRNISEGIIHKYRLGLEPTSKRITIPIMDQYGFCRNIRRMGWLKDHKAKVTNVKGRGEVRLFPEKTMMLKKRVLLVEGEWDALCGMSHGLDCVTWTGGATNVNEKFFHLFRDKAVWILYDNDSAGERGSDLNYLALKDIATDVTPLAVPDRCGKDLTDMIQKKDGWESHLEAEMKDYQFPKKEKQKHYCPTCGQQTKGEVV